MGIYHYNKLATHRVASTIDRSADTNRVSTEFAAPQKEHVMEDGKRQHYGKGRWGAVGALFVIALIARALGDVFVPAICGVFTVIIGMDFVIEKIHAELFGK
ncbi:MAG: hypothetical protein A3D65_06715 [Candidatus Lloydbacteria bacterium RIFCSPHIGHO2_02_FULL_50_13]|uniref:Uncharacterized protein n=1 Tax=Candidatus Lloydbacteria bacterium RIFCSPHIGHO2_02_FULL_50_13 TaxID=1798661 RepID=A0A1G2CZM1_9BACT|nr:MAG: hypothetical protein A3D65_06715 [Candidatus Lloydbacteria bacterium RIFCSPHIGHO2_02_FULL_50_13]